MLQALRENVRQAGDDFDPMMMTMHNDPISAHEHEHGVDESFAKRSSAREALAGARHLLRELTVDHACGTRVLLRRVIRLEADLLFSRLSDAGLSALVEEACATWDEIVALAQRHRQLRGIVHEMMD